MVHWKIATQEKIASNPLKTPVKEQQQKFTMYDLLSLHEIFMYQKLLHAFKTLRIIVNKVKI